MPGVVQAVKSSIHFNDIICIVKEVTENIFPRRLNDEKS